MMPPREGRVAVQARIAQQLSTMLHDLPGFGEDAFVDRVRDRIVVDVDT